MRLYSTTAAILALFSTATSAGAIPASSARRNGRCAVPLATGSRLEHAHTMARLERERMQEEPQAFDGSITVDVYVHVVAGSEALYITQQQVDDQIAYLNTAYNPHNVAFALANTTFTTQRRWAAGSNELAMKTSLRQGSYRDLNLYYVDTPRLDGEVALGYCHFPEEDVEEGSDTFNLDGCVIEAETVPGGTSVPYNLGGTTAHEVGHWFDLYHTFQGGCRGDDQVDDTPAQASQTRGCPVSRDSCPNMPGVDPVHNFMDYSDDACYESFTRGQQIRMHSSWQMMRKPSGS